MHYMIFYLATRQWAGIHTITITLPGCTVGSNGLKMFICFVSEITPLIGIQ